MKHGERDSWPIERFWRAWLVLAALVLGGCELSPGAVHLVQAQVQATPAGTYDTVTTLPHLDERAWATVPLPYTVVRSVAPAGPDAIGTTWVRLDVAGTAQGAGTGLRLYLPRWQTIGMLSVYADGRLVHRSRGGPVWNSFNEPVWVALASDLAGAPALSSVVLRIDHPQGSGVGVSSAWVGTQASLHPRRWVRDMVQLQVPKIASSALMMIGLLSLLAWTARREPVYAWFGISAVFLFLRMLHFHTTSEDVPLSDAWFGWVTVYSLPALAIATNVFALRLCDSRWRRTEAALAVVVAAAAVAGLPLDERAILLAGLAPLLYAATLLAFAVFCAATVYRAARSGSRTALMVAAWNTLSIPAGVHDWLLQNQRIGPEGIYLLPLTGIGLFCGFLYIVLNRYVTALRNRDQAQSQMQQLLARETQLRAMYDRLGEVVKERVLSTERERMMRDMHDALGSSLASAIRAAERGQQQDVAGILRQCLDDLKLAIDSLDPVQNDLLVLLGTLRFRLGARLEQAGVKLDWQLPDTLQHPPRLDPSMSLHILRILQEALTNVVRHSQATRVAVSVREAPGWVVVTVEDDGIGFDARSPRIGRGLANIRHRAAEFAGAARWHSQPGSTRFELDVPAAAGHAVAQATPPEATAHGHAYDRA